MSLGTVQAAQQDKARGEEGLQQELFTFGHNAWSLSYCSSYMDSP